MTTQAPDLTTTFTPAKSCFQYYKYRYTGDEITCQAGGTVHLVVKQKQAGLWYSTDLCTIVLPSTVEVIVSESVVGGDWKRTTVSGAAANAIGLPIRWHSSDFASTTSGTTTSATNSGTETITSSTSTSSSDPSSSNTGLSTGAKAGIGAGVGVVALIGLAALGWFVLRARRARQSSAASAAQEPKEPQMQQQQHPWELDSHEAMSPAELPSDNIPQAR
ncbi:hypothetical protein FPSE_04385 [Fusarium pseudograminearum CS3096]|uniref:Mid2 domain-containing protein n=1 Tax=Fusarium pseudograminearum (strain CS3096) TaxID=1028729 RepID=K3VKR0_FUSPC|nr:hypothetical protein FPSE_04385 [Fusarium pseudograminearum CS3096]EKJ75432.1 hypothetical protein FPSE_04385 [Fusarium pseudograminearum CS3096]